MNKEIILEMKEAETERNEKVFPENRVMLKCLRGEGRRLLSIKDNRVSWHRVLE